MKSFIQSVFMAFVLVAASGSVTATTIDFEDLPGDTYGPLITSDGYNFAGDNFGAVYFTNGAFCGPVCVSNGSRTLLALGPDFGFSNQITMTQSGGGTFQLTGLDAGGVFTGNYPEYDAAQINYVELLGSVTVATGSIGLVEGADGVAAFQTYGIEAVLADTVVFTGLDGTNGNNGFSLDNLVVQDSTVPEPGSLALLGLGILGLLLTGVGRRRHQESAPFFD
jgi:hypothetical protein